MMHRIPALHSTALWLRGLAVALGLNAAVTQAVLAEPRAAVDLASQTMPMLGQAQQMYYLELVVNELSTGRLIPVRMHNDRYYVRGSDLRSASVRVADKEHSLVALDEIQGVTAEYDASGQRLKLSVPADWLPTQDMAADQGRTHTPAEVSFGMLLNYDIYTFKPKGGVAVTAMWSEQRVFDRWGSITNSGTYRTAPRDGAPTGENGFLRYDTTWRSDDQERVLSYTFGDLITGALAWSHPVRMGGVSLERNYSIRPDLITYPLPQFAGQATVPTTVDLYINGSRNNTWTVNPGPFTLPSTPFLNGAGEATLVTTDAVGRPVRTTIPFYVASNLLKQGLYSYSAALGAVRRNFGIDSARYGKAAASVVGRYGVTDTLTVDGQADVGERYALLGMGLSTRRGMAGVVSLAAAASEMNGLHGAMGSIGYSYASRAFSLNLQHVERSQAFRDLSRYDQSATHSSASARSITQASGSIHLGGPSGVLGLAMFDVRTQAGERTRLLNVSYSRSLFQRFHLFVSANKNYAQPGASVQALIVLPLGSVGTVSSSIVRNADNRYDHIVQYNRNAPSTGGVGWSLGRTDGTAHYHQASIAWRNRNFLLGAGLNGQDLHGHSYSRWADLQGSLVWMEGQWTAANRIDDAFVLIDTSGYPGVPVRFENQPTGATSASGRLLVPWATSYYPAKYEIDALNLPANVAATKLEQRMAVRARSGALLKFPVRKIIAASIHLVTPQGQPMAMGSEVRHVQSSAEAVVGWSGRTYLEGLGKANDLSVRQPDGKTCRAEFTLDVEQEGPIKVGPLVCHPRQEP